MVSIEDRLSSYLQIAQTVLRAFRRPMSARAIMNEAIRSNLLPSHLYGSTQHKTLQARLSEDILLRRELSVFFRTAPGQFFLTEFLSDETIPAEFRQPITARRRTRDLIRGEPLLVSTSVVNDALPAEETHNAADFFGTIPEYAFRYNPYPETFEELVPVWSLGYVRRGNSILCHRAGSYRDERDQFSQKRTLTFATLTLESDHTLFDSGHMGIESSALSAVAVDLDISSAYGGLGLSEFTSSACFVRKDLHENRPQRLLVYVEISPPNWFEPVTRRLSLNDMRWISISPPPNNIDDFDPWSRALIEVLSHSSNQLAS